jgi:hypothetical protein
VPQTPRPAWRAYILVAIALVLLNASLTFENVWPTPAIQWGRAVSVELAGLVLLLTLTRRSAGWVVRRLLPALWVVLVAGRYSAVTAPGLYGREFNVYWDAQHLGNVAAMLGRAVPPWVVLLAAGGAAVAIALAYVLARAAITWVAGAMAHRATGRVVAAAAAAFVVLFACQQLLPAFPGAVTFADPVTPVFARQARFVASMIGPWRVSPSLGPSPAFDAGLEQLRGADVLLVFVESYGAVTYETPAIAEGLVASRAQLEAAVRDTGRDAVTAYVESPTFGGSSWLAHLSLISGVEARDQYAYASLMASRRETLVTAFTRRGYRAVALMPGMRQVWPEGAFYQFAEIYGSDRLDYQGPYFGWWTIPDQWALARFDALEHSRAPREPLFAVFPTSTTHAPFGPVAPYQPDWSRVLSADPFDADELERALAEDPELGDLRTSYVRAVAYEYTVFAGYLREHADDDLVMILIGDHQPPAAVTGPDAPWRVPVHVITRNAPVLEALAARGFRWGFEPHLPSLGPMHALVPMLLEAFSGAAGAEEGAVPVHVR